MPSHSPVGARAFCSLRGRSGSALTVPRDAYPLSVRVAAPTLELLEWAAARIRTYDDVREAWRSNCPRTAVWDDAVTDGLVRIDRLTDAGCAAVVLTARGQAALDASR
jgi:hypothetical protein